MLSSIIALNASFLYSSKVQQSSAFTIAFKASSRKSITSRFLYIDNFAENSLTYSWFKGLLCHKIHIDPQEI